MFAMLSLTAPAFSQGAGVVKIFVKSAPNIEDIVGALNKSAVDSFIKQSGEVSETEKISDLVKRINPTDDSLANFNKGVDAAAASNVDGIAESADIGVKVRFEAMFGTALAADTLKSLSNADSVKSFDEFTQIFDQLLAIKKTGIKTIPDMGEEVKTNIKKAYYYHVVSEGEIEDTDQIAKRIFLEPNNTTGKLPDDLEDALNKGLNRVKNARLETGRLELRVELDNLFQNCK